MKIETIIEFRRCSNCKKPPHAEDESGNLYDLKGNPINDTDICNCPDVGDVPPSGTECPACESDFYYCNCDEEENDYFWTEENKKKNLEAYPDFPWYNKP